MTNETASTDTARVTEFASNGFFALNGFAVCVGKKVVTRNFRTRAEAEVALAEWNVTAADTTGGEWTYEGSDLEAEALAADLRRAAQS